MKTTIELPDALLRRTKALAALRGVSMRELIAQALEAELRQSRVSPGWRRLVGRAKKLDTKPVRDATLSCLTLAGNAYVGVSGNLAFPSQPDSICQTGKD